MMRNRGGRLRLLRYIDIETKAKLDGTSLGDVKIDPWVYGLNFGYRF